MPLSELLHFGTGMQAIHYFLFCLVAIFGALQAVGARYRNRDIVWFEGGIGYILGIMGIAGGGAWFFLTDDEIFTPGLAGAELFVVFAAAFVLAVILTRLVALCLNRLRSLSPIPRPEREKEPLS